MFYPMHERASIGLMPASAGREGINMKKWINREKAVIIIQAMLIAFAVQWKPERALNRADYKSAVHYLYAQATGLLGEYSLVGLLIFGLALGFLFWVRGSGREKAYTGRVLPIFFSFCLLTGQSYAELGSWEGCFGDLFRVIGFLAALAGYAVLLRYLIALFLEACRRAANAEWSVGWAERFFGKNCFRNVFLLLLIWWMPVLLLSYPGNLCYDGLGQIEQSLGMYSYSSHHPLLHTLLMGWLIKGGKFLTGGNDAGLFCYLLLQAAALAAALAGTVSRLTKRGASLVMRLEVTGVYVLAPMYSNMASTVVKDVPFLAAALWYFLLLEELTAEGFQGRKPLFWVKCLFAQLLTGFLRNNGIYMVVLTGVILTLVWGKGRAARKKLILLLNLVLLPFLLYTAGNGLMVRALSAEKGSVAEMLSIPFQQTARYLQLYGNELTAEEREAIEGVLEDVSIVAERYDPDIADPVKALYRKDASFGELAAYLRVWAAGFFRHPAVYLQAFLAHIYGWFDPGVTNAIRYEAVSDLFRQEGLFPGARKLLVFWYRFLEYLPPLALLENVGFYTWLLFILAGETIREKRKKGVLLIPLFISLLICMAAPCFYLHPRYAYPILFAIPFLYGTIFERKTLAAGV